MDQATTEADGVDPLGPVFISYRQSDGAVLAVALAWALRAAGIPVWQDETDLPPGDTSKRLAEALESGLSGAILLVTPEIERSEVVPGIELPALLELADDPSFTLSIASTIGALDRPTMLDHTAPDRLLGTVPGTLSAFEHSPAITAEQRAGLARKQARRRIEHAKPNISERQGNLLLDLQTRVPPFATRQDGHLVVRLRPPVERQRRPHPSGLHDLQLFLGQLPQLLAIGGATSVTVRGGAHLSVACTFGAAMPTTLLGSVTVLDTDDVPWALSGQAPTEGPEPLLHTASPPTDPSCRGPVLVYVDLLPHRNDAPFDDLAADREFAAVLHLRPIADGLLEPDRADAIAGAVSQAIRELAGAHGTTEVHLLLRCPYPLALLIGRTLNTLTVHLYEWEDADVPDEGGSRYVPSIVLRSGAGGSPIHAVSSPPVTPDLEEA